MWWLLFAGPGFRGRTGTTTARNQTNKLKLILLAVAAAAICQSAHALSGVGQNGGDYDIRAIMQTSH